MIEYYFKWGGSAISSFSNELKVVFIYFTEHYWLAFFFILQILLVRFLKTRGDNINQYWAFRTPGYRINTLIVLAVMRITKNLVKFYTKRR